MRTVLALVVLASGCFYLPDRHPALTDDGGRDGNGSGSDALPANTNLVFVTKNVYQLPVESTPEAALHDADTTCSTAAMMAGRSGTFVAWLSTTNISAVSRLGSASGWIRPDGAPFGDTPASIMAAGKVFAPPIVDEYGDRLSSLPLVATATGPDGSAAFGPAGVGTCLDFSDITANRLWTGIASSTTGAWTKAEALSCSSAQLHLYCFQTDFATTVMPARTPGKLAFITRAMFQPSAPDGVNGADTLCRSEAMAAGNSSQFTALIATSALTPRQRINHTGPWVRPDGTLVSTDLDALVSPINQQLDETYTNELVWTGTTGLTTAGTASSTCNDWTSLGGVGHASTSSYTNLDNGFTDPQCTMTYAVYCVEDD